MLLQAYRIPGLLAFLTKSNALLDEISLIVSGRHTGISVFGLEHILVKLCQFCRRLEFCVTPHLHKVNT